VFGAHFGPNLARGPGGIRRASGTRLASPFYPVSMPRVFLVMAVVSLLPAGWLPPVEVQGTTTLAGKALADAVVWLDAPEARSTTGQPEVVLDQRNLSFSPHVLAVQMGTRVKFPNDDRVFHNVFSFHDGKKFNLGLYPVGAVKYVPFDRPGLSRIFCNIHPQMAAYVMVVDTPYFAVSDQAGHFVIRGVPPGVYTSHAWRPGGPLLNDSVVVGPDALVQIRWP
jgi:plastocyanin